MMLRIRQPYLALGAVLAFAAVVALAAPTSPVAQETAGQTAPLAQAAGPTGATLSDLEGLARTIENEAERAKFLRDLRAAIAAGKKGIAEPEARRGPGWIFRISAMMRDVSGGLLATVATL